MWLLVSGHARKTASLSVSVHVKKGRNYQCSCEKDSVAINEYSCGKRTQLSVSSSCEKDRVAISECSCAEKTAIPVKDGYQCSREHSYKYVNKQTNKPKW